MDTVVLSPRIGEAVYGLELASLDTPPCLIYEVDEYAMDYPTMVRYPEIPPVPRHSPYADRALNAAEVVVGADRRQGQSIVGGVDTPKSRDKQAPELPRTYHLLERIFDEAASLSCDVYLGIFTGYYSVRTLSVTTEMQDFLEKQCKRKGLYAQLLSIPLAWYGVPSPNNTHLLLISKKPYAYPVEELQRQIQVPTFESVTGDSGSTEGERLFNESPYVEFMLEVLGKKWRSAFIGSFQNYLIRSQRFGEWSNWIAARRGKSRVYYSFYEDARDRIFGSTPMDRSPKVLKTLDKWQSFSYAQVVHPLRDRYLTIAETAYAFGISAPAAALLDTHEFGVLFDSTFKFWRNVPAACYSDVFWTIANRQATKANKRRVSYALFKPARKE